jgi:hypothetical protein
MTHTIAVHQERRMTICVAVGPVAVPLLWPPDSASAARFFGVATFCFGIPPVTYPIQGKAQSTATALTRGPRRATKENRAEAAYMCVYDCDSL